MSEPIIGSEDRRSEDDENALFGRSRPTPAVPSDPTSAPTPQLTPGPQNVTDPAVADRLTTIERRTTAVHNRLEEVARALGLLGRRLQEQTVREASAGPDTAADDTRIRALEDAVRRLPGQADLSRLVDDAVARTVEPLTENLDRVHTMQERELALIDGLSAALDAEGAGMRMDQERMAAMLAALRDDLADAELGDSGAASTAAWSDVLTRVERAMTAQANRIEAVLAAVRGAVSEQLERQQHDLTMLVSDVIDEVARAREVTADRIQAATTAVDEGTAQVAAHLLSGETAMADQLDAVRTTLAAVTGPLAELERRTDDLATAADRSADALGVGRTRLDAVETAMATMTEALVGFEELITDRLRAAASAALDDASDEMRSARQAVETAGGAVADQLRQAIDDIRAQLEATMQAAREEAAGRARETLDAAADRLQEATGQATETATRLEAFENVLAAVLAEHDQALADQRAQLVYDLVSSLADNLTKRERKRLAAKIEVPPAPQTVDMSRRLREVFELAANRDLTGLARDDESVDDRPGPPLPKRVVRSPLADLIEDGDDLEDDLLDLEPPIGQDPGFEELLEGVSGLPATTRGRLVDEFGSLAALQAADDDTVMSVRGVGPALLERLRRLPD